MVKSAPGGVGDLPGTLTTDINAVIRSNINALRRQMTHDHLAATKFVKSVSNGRKQLGWDTLFKYMSLDPQLREDVETELSVVVAEEGWHLQGNEVDYPPISVKKLAEKAGVSGRRLREFLIEQSGLTSTAKQLTLLEALAIAAATNTSIQQLLTPPWREIHKLDTLYGGRVEYLPNQNWVGLDNWLHWVFGLEALPHQNEFVFERTQSFPPQLGLLRDRGGHQMHRNSRPSPAEIIDFNQNVMLGNKTSWFSSINQRRLFPSTPPSEEDTWITDADDWSRPFKGAFLLTGLLTHIRRLLRVSRKVAQPSRLNSHWILVTANVSFLLGRMARSVSRRPRW